MIHGEIVNFNEVFKGLKTPPLIANDLSTDTEQQREALNAKLFTTYEGDCLNTVPMCGCRKTSGGYLSGTVCPFCFTEVMPDLERPIESLMWLAPPSGVPVLPNPHVYAVLSPKMTEDGFNYLKWMLDPTYKEPDLINAKPKLRQLKKAGVQRGIGYLYEHFDEVMEIYLEGKAKAFEKRQIRTFIGMYRDCIFANYIPMPSKVAFVVEENSTVNFHDKTMVSAINAMRIITSIDQSIRPPSLARKEKLVIESIDQLATFYKDYISTTLSKKEGILRRQVFGGKLHFTFRAVIASITEAHHYEEMHIPWEIAMNAFRIHITNILDRRGYTPVQIDQIFVKYARRHHPVLADIFRMLIGGPRGKALSNIPVLFNRNPTQGRGSMERHYITKVIEDVNITTIRFSPLCLVGYNADPFKVKTFSYMLVLFFFGNKTRSRLGEILNLNLLNCLESLVKRLR